MLLSRRTLLLATAGLSFAPVPAFGAGTYRGARVGFSIDGEKFGLVVTESSKGVLVTVRSLSGKFRAAGLMKPEAFDGAKEVTLKGAGRTVQVSVGGDGDLKVSGGGVQLGSVEPVPTPAAPETQGFFGSLWSAFTTALEAVAVGIAAGLAWLVGAEFQYTSERMGIWVTGDSDIKLWIHGSGDGVVAPPDDVDELPGVWY